jgi:hypothetical protein
MSVLNQLVKYIPDLVGFVVPVFVEFINKNIKNDNARFIMTILVCLIVSALLKLQSLSMGSVDNFFQSAILIFSESQIIFKLYFKDSYVRMRIQESFTKKPDETFTVPERVQQ